jgi:hypothetical protein
VAIFSPRNVQIELRDHDFVLGIIIMRSNQGEVLVFEKILFYTLKFKGLLGFKFINKKKLLDLDPTILIKPRTEQYGFLTTVQMWVWLSFFDHTQYPTLGG